MSSESDLMDSLLAPRAHALRRPRSKPSYFATLFVHLGKSSLAVYLSWVPEGAVRIAEAPEPFLQYAPSHSSCQIASMTGGFCEGADGVQSATKSANTWDLIALRGTKSMVCDANSVAHFPILPEASLFSNMSRRGKDVGTLILKL